MKRCPTCNQVFFDEALSFCTDDGSILEVDASGEGTAPTLLNSDPMATMVSPGTTSPTYAPPPTGGPYGSSPGSFGGEIPGSAPMAPHSWQSPPSQPDWNAPAQPAAWQPPPPPGYGIANRSPQQGLAIASMICGLVSITLGWICLGPVEAVAAIIMGIIALVMAKNDPGKFGGKPFAFVGIGTGAAVLLLTIGIWIIYVVILGASSMSR
ncbi:MAG: DUF4190 domain-containing protein [Pyrinomonadaceae bacterium]